jgi:hypothetical protein
MELTPFLEAASRSATQEFPNILREVQLPYLVHKDLLLVPILSQQKSIITTPIYITKIFLILYSPLCQDLSSDLLLSGFPTNNQYSATQEFPNFLLKAELPYLVLVPILSQQK